MNKWSMQTVEYLKNAKRLFPNAGFIKYSNDLEYVTILNYHGEVIANIYHNTIDFVDLMSSEIYSIDDIIGGTE